MTIRMKAPTTMMMVWMKSVQITAVSPPVTIVAKKSCRLTMKQLQITKVQHLASSYDGMVVIRCLRGSRGLSRASSDH